MTDYYGTENRLPTIYPPHFPRFFEVELVRLPAMSTHPQRIGVAAITENLLKRKWSSVILRYLHQGLNDPAEISKIETSISTKVMSERLRTMVRYGLIARFPRPSPSAVIEYRLTALGKKILEMIDCINSLDEQFRQGRFALRGKLDASPEDQGLEDTNETDSSTTAPLSTGISVRP